MISKDKRFATIGLIMALGLSQAAFGAQLYTDVPEKFWAEKAILTVTDKDIMPGYSDATFKPAQNASKLEGVTVVFRSLKKAGLITETEVQTALDNQKTVLSDYKIPLMLSPYGSDAQAACAFVIDKGILQKEEVRTFMVSGKLTEVRKLELSVYTGKLLNYFLKEDLNKFFVLEYADSDDISQASAPYVNLLVEKGILSAKGDVYGKFNAGSSVNRAVLASMAASVSDYATKNIKGAAAGAVTTPPTTTTPTTTPSTTPVTTPTTTVSRGTTGSDTVVLGELVPYQEAAQAQGGQLMVTVEKNNTTTKMLTAKDGTGKLVNLSYANAQTESEGKAISPQYLKAGQELLVTYNGSEAQKIVIYQKYKRITGYIGDLKETTESNGQKTRMMTVTTASGGSYNLKLSGLSTPLVLTRDFLPTTADKLTTSDMITLWAEGTDIKGLETYSRSSLISVSLLSSSTFKAGSTFTVQLPNGKQVPWILEKDLNLAKSDKTLAKGDLLKLTIEYGSITRVESAGIKAMDSGKIRQITIGTKSSIVLYSTDGREYTYALSPQMKLIKGNMAYKEPFYGLRLGQDVTLTNAQDGVLKMEIGAATPIESQQTGYTVKEVIPSANLLRVTDANQKEWLIVSKASVKLDLSGYRVGDKLDIKGMRIAEGVLEAESLSRLSN